MALAHKIRYKIKELVDLDEIWKGRRVRRAEFSGLLEIFINCLHKNQNNITDIYSYKFNFFYYLNSANYL